MASIETLVAFARNGLCVCVDTLPSTHFLKLPLKAIMFDLATTPSSLPAWVASWTSMVTIEELSVLNVCIASLQGCAVVFNMSGALGLPAAISEYRRLRVIESRLALKSRSRVAEVGASLAVRRASSSMAFALVRLLLGPSFGVLALYTLRLASQRLLEWALLLMQIALAIALYAMWRELGWRRQKAANATILTTNPTTDDPSVLATLDELPPPNSDGLVALVSKADDAEKVRERCDSWVKIVRKVASENQAELRTLALREREGIRLDARVFWLNVVAFFGYLVFPATYFGPFLRDPHMEWLGNFAGDLAWTLEPALIIATTFRQRSATKTKAD
ncbi:hypothetical protein CTAYLR_010146 [Chrysophaeum taylorii]|uniref:Uncharacterized protein n=1 Tax=Chrysophaeum taylorii TaxID=2483200 RepID=A0AAD7XM88_9STRA|nr:hypothetical protein CTAYLR_010146 [Chrysophaeum taylorii]